MTAKLRKYKVFQRQLSPLKTRISLLFGLYKNCLSQQVFLMLFAISNSIRNCSLSHIDELKQQLYHKRIFIFAAIYFIKKLLLMKSCPKMIVKKKQTPWLFNKKLFSHLGILSFLNQKEGLKLKLGVFITFYLWAKSRSLNWLEEGWVGSHKAALWLSAILETLWVQGGASPSC